MSNLLFEGRVEHARLHPVVHRFHYSTGFVAVDVDELPRLDRELRGFGFNRFAPFSIREQDYLAPGGGSFREKLTPWLEKIGQPGAGERVLLVTCPRWLGRVFNPVSFYLLYDGSDALCGLIAEVNNTFGDRHVYAVPLEKKEGLWQRDREEKAFHVSPFNDMNGSYQFTVRHEGKSIYIGVDLHREGRRIMETWIEGEGVPFTSAALRRQALRHPLRPWLTMPRICVQAGWLWLRHRLKVHRRPEPSHPDTIIRSRS